VNRSIVALLAACWLAVTGCQSGAPAPGAASPTPGVAAPAAAAAAPTRPAHASQLFTVTFADPKTFNPIITVDANSAAAVADVFDSLVRLNPRTTEIEPALAERWEISPDGKTVTFFLRHDVKWHDGQPLTAADVVFTFDVIYDERVPNSMKSVLTIDGQRIAVEAVDDYTVRMRLPHPFAPLLNGVSVPIVPKHVLGEALAAGEFARRWGIDTPPDQIIGSGPYRLEKYVPTQYIQLTRNPGYWMRDESGQSLPYLEKQTIRIVPNQDTAYLKFLAGEVDLHTPRPEEVADLRAQATARDITVREIGLDTGTLFVTFNRNPQHYRRDGAPDPRLAWFTDLNFLRAIAHSIDREAIINTVLNGYGKPAASYLSPENTRFYDPNLTPYPYDLERARQLLRDGGYTDRDGSLTDRDGNRIEFTLYTNAGNQLREKICAILKEDWDNLGMKVNFKALDFGLLVEKLDVTFDWDAMLMGFTGSVEPHNAANLLRSSGNLHLWQPNQQQPASEWEAEIDRQLEIGARALDPEQRRQAYWRIQEILNEQLPMIQTVHALRFTAYTNTLQNYAPAVWGVYRPELLRFAP
jgi:peptide/nickel transport system substrate-binding protein